MITGSRPAARAPGSLKWSNALRIPTTSPLSAEQHDDREQHRLSRRQVVELAA
jgi:hypothetical protein